MNCTLGVNKDCIKAYNRLEFNCMFAEHTIPYIKTPFFAIQSRFDLYQTSLLMINKDDIDRMNNYGDMFMGVFVDTIMNGTKNGIFLDSCYHHGSGRYDITINNMIFIYAFQKYYNQGEPRYYIQNERYFCNKCCNT
jgi:hypothetical protein